MRRTDCAPAVSHSTSMPQALGLRGLALGSLGLSAASFTPSTVHVPDRDEESARAGGCLYSSLGSQPFPFPFPNFPVPAGPSGPAPADWGGHRGPVQTRRPPPACAHKGRPVWNRAGRPPGEPETTPLFCTKEADRSCLMREGQGDLVEPPLRSAEVVAAVRQASSLFWEPGSTRAG